MSQEPPHRRMFGSSYLCFSMPCTLASFSSELTDPDCTNRHTRVRPMGASRMERKSKRVQNEITSYNRLIFQSVQASSLEPRGPMS